MQDEQHKAQPPAQASTGTSFSSLTHSAGPESYASLPLVLQDDMDVDRDEVEMRYDSDNSAHSAAELLRQFIWRRRRKRWTWRDDLEAADQYNLPADSFTGPEADVIHASAGTGFSFQELTSIVLMSHDTILLPFDIVVVGPDLFREMGGGRESKVTMTVDDIMTALSKPRVRNHIMSLRIPILNSCLLENTMNTVKAIQDFELEHLKVEGGALSLDAWLLFLRSLLQKRIQYSNRLHLLRLNKFAGLGLESKANKRAGPCSLVPRGYFEDLARFTRNNHPLLVLFLADRDHPYTTAERRADFAGALIMNFASGALVLLPGALVNAGYFSERMCNNSTLGSILVFLYSIVVCAVPATLFRQITYFLFAAPCLVHDETNATREVTFCIELCGLVASSLGHIIVCMWSMVFLILGCVFWFSGSITVGSSDNADDDALVFLKAGPACSTSRTDALAIWAVGVFKYWIVWFVGVLAFDFNPSRRVSKCLDMLINGILSVLTCGCTCCTGAQLFRIGQWHAERAKVLAIIRTKIDLRGEKRFHIADQYTPCTPPMSPMGSFG